MFSEILFGRESGGGEGSEIEDDKGDHYGFAEMSCGKETVGGNNAMSFGGDCSTLNSVLEIGYETFDGAI